MLAAPAFAADLRMPVKAPVVAPAPYFNWSGCYIGVHGGGAWGDKRAFIAPPSGAEIFAFDTSGGLAGGQVGCDFQTGAFVFGLEGSASWASISGNGNDLFTGGISRLNVEAEWIATATGRIGWAFGQTLLYAKGGGAWVHDHYRLFDLNGGLGLGMGALVSTTGRTHAGWTVGGGVEWAFAPSWSVKVEYNYIDLGRERHHFTLVPAAAGVGPGLTADIDQTLHVVKAGINYRFNFGGPVVASY
jgi:outer membrane immunogenic protein